MRVLLTVFFVGVSAAWNGAGADEAALERGFRTPPEEARLHCYWWWLNGNVTKEAITRDLEAMQEKGFGGALIMDAGGAEQDGNRQVPHGPDFASPQWRELYRHALQEAARLKLELALNIQSGWNLGGPSVAPEDAAKILCPTETVVAGPANVSINLPAPPTRHGLLREVAVLAVPERVGDRIACQVTASSAHQDHPVALACDANRDTFWVSGGEALPDGALAWIRLAFDRDRAVRQLLVSGRPKYGPKALEVFAVGTDGTRRKVKEGRVGQDGTCRLEWEPPQTVRLLELRVTEAYDPAPVAGRARNVQIAELGLAGPDWQWPTSPTASIARWEEKVLLRPVAGANHDLSFLVPSPPRHEQHPAIDSTQVLNLSRSTDAAGRLQWQAPAGTWRIYRFCYTVAPHARVSTCSQGWNGLALDPLDAGAFQRYWDAVMEPLMQDARTVGGSALRYLHTDSWEIEPFNWTARLPEEFQRRCGYDMTPWLPVLARCVVGSTEASERFLHDFRKTVAVLTAEQHYGPFLSNAHRHGLHVRAESGGPHGVPIDAQHCLGIIDVPMSEFWANSWRHRVPAPARFFIKQSASAAHTYGRPLVAAEGFTTIGPHWQETVWDNLKPNFDRALCEGLNQLVWCLVTCSPREMGLPGQEMFPGTHFNPNSTWWRHSEGFLSYINRCQWLLRQGRFVADVLYYYGDLAPNFAGLKTSNPAQLPAGYDYDVASEHVILNRLSVQARRLVLPDGMSYGALVLPPHRTIALPVLRKLEELARAGAVIIGPRPESSSGLRDWQTTGDRETKELLQRLWPALVPHATAAEWLKHAGLPPDCSATDELRLDYIHRRDGETDIYFVVNPERTPVRGVVKFRVGGKSPEYWDPVTGSIRTLPEWHTGADGRIEVPVALEAFGSAFVVFRNSRREPPTPAQNFPQTKPLLEILGPWQVAFDPAWFYPDDGTHGNTLFAKLEDWTKRPEPAIRHFSGAAVYRTKFDFPAASDAGQSRRLIALGEVREMARVRINDRDLGIAWCPPWTVEVPPGTLAARDNRLEVEVVNFWPNRLIGDASLPRDERRTKTNITKFDDPKGDRHYTTLMPSGLLGPVRLLASE
jgi:hypothetical protein